MIYRGRGWGRGKLDEDSQKVQIQYRLNKYWGCNVQYDNIINTVVCYT